MTTDPKGSPNDSVTGGAATHPRLATQPRLEEHRRLRARYIEGQLRPADRRLYHYSAIIGILGVILYVALEVGPTPSTSGPECAAAPGPGVNWSSCDLAGLDATGAVLSGATLRNSSLAGARLSAARLPRADLSYADLSGADLSYSEAAGSVLIGANLRGADLTYARLHGADLSYANLSGATLGGAELHNARLDRAIWLDGSMCAQGSVGRCLPSIP